MLGFAFVLFVVAVGLATLVTAVSFSVKPTERKLGFLRPLTASVAFGSVASLLAGVSVTLKRAADTLPITAGRPEMETVHGTLNLAGFAEAAVPAVLGFALLAVAWLFVAVGLRKLT